jgi:hypothetical protein
VGAAPAALLALRGHVAARCAAQYPRRAHARLHGAPSPDAAAAGIKTLREDCEDKDRGRTNTLEFAMPYGKSPALGWFLVSESQELMHNVLCLGEHKAALLATRERLEWLASTNAVRSRCRCRATRRM